MTEHRSPDSRWSSLLEEYAEEIPVRPPPVSLRPRRRRRPIPVLVIGGLVAAIAVIAVVAAPGRDDGGARRPLAPADGTYVDQVGVGPVVVTVPPGWGVDASRCGVPTADTVLRPAVFVPFCTAERPAGVESIEFGADGDAAPVPSGVGTSAVVDGVEALVVDEGCPTGGGTVCTRRVSFPASGVDVWLTTDDGEDGLDGLLALLEVRSDRVGVPTAPTSGPDGSEQGQESGLVEGYLDRLRGLGLEPVVVREEAAGGPGRVLRVEPGPGTVVARGEVVEVVVAESASL